VVDQLLTKTETAQNFPKWTNTGNRSDLNLIKERRSRLEKKPGKDGGREGTGAWVVWRKRARKSKTFNPELKGPLLGGGGP